MAEDGKDYKELYQREKDARIDAERTLERVQAELRRLKLVASILF